MKKRLLIAFYTVILLGALYVVRADCTAGTTVDDALYGPTTTCTGPRNTIPENGRGRYQFSEPSTVTHGSRTYQVQTGGAVTVNEDGSTDLEGAAEVTTGTGTQARHVLRATLRHEVEHYEQAERIERPSEDLILEEVQNADVGAAGGDMQAERAKRATIGDVVAFDAEGVSKRSGILRIAKASRIEVKDGILTQVVQFQGTGIQFHVGAAQDVLNGCVLLKDVWDSDFTVTDKELKIEPGKGVQFNIADCRFSQSTFTAFSEQSKLAVSKSRNGNYEMTDGKLECHGPGSKETIETNESAAIEYGQECFRCLSITAPGTYWQNSMMLERDFGLHVPASKEPYRLCLKKEQLDYFADFDGLIDFVESKMDLSGIVEYLRYPTVNDSVASLLMMPVYQSLDHKNRALLSLDAGMDQVESLSLTNADPAEGMVSWVSHGHYAVYEVHDNNMTRRYGSFLDELHPEVLQEYGSFSNTRSLVSFPGNELLQLTADEKGERASRAVCDSCNAAAELVALAASQLNGMGARCAAP